MCYLVAKQFNKPGCMAVQSEYGPSLASLVTYLGRKTLGSGMQILTVSSKEAYGEYAPYEVISSEKDFINRVLTAVENT